MAHLDFQTGTQRPTHTFNLTHFYPRSGKRLLDLTLALLLLPVLAPVIFVIACLVRRDGAAGLFAHPRVGQHGVTFTCWKIRTMVPDAEARLAACLATHPARAAEWARSQKLQDDPRTTRLGWFLRRTSIDELPQIWNVLRGEMSLVGPRPITAPELERYGLHQNVYLDLKPGITGLWQTAGRANGCYVERLSMDRSYAQSIRMMRDIGLILRTVRVVFRPTGR